MGGEIKVVKKNSPGTIMQLYLLLNTPIEGAGQHCQLEFGEHSLVVSKVAFISHLWLCYLLTHYLVSNDRKKIMTYIFII